MKQLRIKRTCKGCGKTFTQVGKRVRKFCSMKCYLKSSYILTVVSKAGIRAHKLHPYLRYKRRDGFKEFIKLHPEHQRKAGRVAGLLSVENGRLFRDSGFGRSFKHGKHFHRSKPELRVCEILQSIFGKSNIVANYHLGNWELDFIILSRGGNVDEFESWRYVLEYHPHDKEPELYAMRRRVVLHSLGIRCPIIIWQEYEFNPFKSFDNENWCREVWN